MSPPDENTGAGTSSDPSATHVHTNAAGDQTGNAMLGSHSSSTVLAIPDLAPDTDMLTAALDYAKCGWYVLPVASGTKNPGSVVGRAWPAISSRDPQVIAAWFAGTNYGIALHVGRSRAVVFDVDNPDKVPEWMWEHLNAAAYQSTRPDQPRRGHYVFATPPGCTFGNSTGELGKGWGEIRGANGVIIAAPTPHPDGGEYRWGTAA